MTVSFHLLSSFHHDKHIENIRGEGKVNYYAQLYLTFCVQLVLMKIALLDGIKFRMKPLNLYCMQTCLEIHILAYMHTFF